VRTSRGDLSRRRASSGRCGELSIRAHGSAACEWSLGLSWAAAGAPDGREGAQRHALSRSVKGGPVG
jgi:hypothetical protein